MLSGAAACCCVVPIRLVCPAGSWSLLPHRAEGFPGLVPSFGSLWVQPFPSPASAPLFLVVPKTCIGGSGARTTRVEQRVAPPVFAGVSVIWGLLGTGVLLARLLGPWLQCRLQCIWQFVNCFFFRLLCWLRPREPRVSPCSSLGVCGSYCQPWLGVSGILVCGCCGLALACGPSAFDLEAQTQALLRSCALSVLLSLVGLLAGPLGWAGSPLGRPLALLCRKGTCPCHCLARCAQTDVPVLPWSGQRHPAAVRPKRVPTCSRKGLGLLGWLLWSQPCLVWAPPPGLVGAIEDLESVAAGLPDSLTPSVPVEVAPRPVVPRPGLDPPVSAGQPASSSRLPSWSSVVADVRREALHEVGIPDPVAVPGSGVLPADRHVPGMPPYRVPGRFQCSTFVVSPGYMPERLQLTWNVPSEARDIERLVARHLPHNCYPFASHVLAAHPQPSADFAAFLAIPEWVTYAGLSGVVLDLRAATLQQDGPTIGTYLSRPTSLAEIEREAGFYSMGAFTVLVGASMVPLRRDEQVFLENGSLVRLIRAEFPLDRCASLTDLLESDDFSHFQGPFPHVPEPRALMILHRSGRFLFGAGRSAGQPIHTAIVNFVGVPAGSVTFHSPSDGCAERISHRGSNVRGVLVLADRLPPSDQSIVIFLDLRPVAAGLSYLCLAHPRLGYDDLEGLLPRLIPAGWRLTVLGGRRRSEHLEVSHRDTLVLGLVSVLDPVDVAPPDSPAPSEGPGTEEDGEEESPTEDRSQSSTRSRSRVGVSGHAGRVSPSSDRSFHGSFGVEPESRAAMYAGPLAGVLVGRARCTPTTCDFQGLWGGIGSLDGSLALCAPWPAATDLRALAFGGLPPIADGLEGLSDCLLPGCSLSHLDLRVRPDAGAMAAIGHRLPHLPPPTGMVLESGANPDLPVGLRFPEGRNAPQHHLPVFMRPAPMAFPEPQQLPFRATVMVLVPEYTHEVVEVDVWQDMTVPEMLACVQDGRDAVRRGRFDRLLPARPQPASHFATVVAFADWHRGTFVVFDCLRYNGTLYSALVSAVMDKGSLVSVAGIRPEQNVEVYVADYPFPLQAADAVDLRSGYTIHFVAQGFPHFAVVMLQDMLRTPGTWAAQVDLPVLAHRWLYLVSDDEPCFFHVRPERRLTFRADIAAHLGYDIHHLQTVPTVPRVSDFCDFGAYAQHVFVATQFPLRDPVSGVQRGVYLLDLRPLHAGLTWGFASGFSVRAQVLVDRFTRTCPASHYVSISGAAVRHEDDGVYFDFVQGQVLTVDFQPLPESSSDGVPSDSEASVPGTPRSHSDGGRRSDVSGSSSDRAPGTPGPANGRSRSPAAGRQHSCRVARATVPGHSMIVCSPVQWSRDMWVWGLFQHAQRTGAPGFTSVYLHLICGLGLLVLGLWAVWFRGSPFAFLCLHCVRSRPCRIDLLAVCLCFLCTVSWHPMALAMQTVARPSMVPGRGSLKSAPVGRPVPTPCRMRQHAALRAAEVYEMTAGDVSDSESEDEGCLDKPPVRRATVHEPRGFLALDRDVGAGDSDPDYWLDTGRLLQATLLRLASARGDCTAFAVAVALLDVLFEAFPPDAAPPVQRIVSLEESVPITSFQRQALGLQALLPMPLPWCQPTDLVDWLDRDLRMLCGDGQVPANKRALFRQVVSWHGRAAELTPRRVLVYTDGSATPVGEATDIAPGAWAVSVWIESAEDSREYLLGCAADVMVTTDDFRFVGAHSDSPLECEQVALVWGLAWIIQYGAALQLPIVVRYDCQAAGLGAFGGAKAPKETGLAQPSGLSLFLCQLRQLACAGALLTHEHVRAHVGHVANELCDELSKQARRLPVVCCGDMLPCWPGRLLRHPLREWAWLPHRGSPDMPTLFAFESEADRLQRADLVGPAGPCLGFTGTGPSAQPVELRLCLVTFNVLSLLDPTSGTGTGNVASGQGMRVIAKREILKRQFLAQDVLLAGLQETRLRDEATLPDKDYFILCAPADARGHFGVSLWASKEVPYARQGGRLLRLQLNYLTVVACEPRLLVVQICAPHFRATATVVVAHAPSEPPAPPGAAESFWAKCRRVLQRRPARSDIIVLSDANARVGALPSSSVGGLDPEPENASGQAFHAFLADMQLWVPATFPECHIGPSSTWWAPSGQGHRLDYVGVPVHWPAACLSTRVWCGFEFLQLRDDHVPTLMAASFVVGRQGEAGGHYVRKAVRPCPGACPVTYGPRLEALKLLPAAAWHTGVDEHFSGVASAWRALGNSVCEPASAKPLQTYLTQATMRLVVLRKECRLHLRALKARARRRCLSLWFLGWRAALAARPWCPSEAVAAMRWVRGLLPWIGRASLLIFRYGRLIRAGAKADRIAYLDGLVQAVSLADLKDPKQLFRQVRAAFPQARSARRSAFTPLPAVLDSDGQLAACAEARFECWRLHFASQEAGEVCQHAEYRQVLCDQKGARTRQGTVFDIHCVPTLTAVEQTVASLPYGKASGYDGLTGELLRLHVPATP